MRHISIIIVNYNTPEDTSECLRSLVKIKHSSFEYAVCVVDNGSKQLYELPADVPKKRFEVIRSDANLGFTGGNNLGIYTAIEYYNSDYVLLLNNDTIVDKNFLEELLAQAEEDPEVGMICPKIYFSPEMEFHNSYSSDERGSILWYAGGSIDWQHLVAFHRGVDEVDRGHFDSQSSSDFATGCCVLIQREVLEKIGTFDKHFFLYMEDVDLSVRAREAGYTIAFCPIAVVWHKNAGSSGGSGSELQEYYQTRNRLYFAFKHGSWKVKAIASILILRYLVIGNKAQRTGALHVLTGQFGKQQLV